MRPSKVAHILTKKLLNDLYWNKGLSQSQIAKKFSINQTGIWHYMKVFDVPVRPWRAKPIRNCIDCHNKLKWESSRKGCLRCGKCWYKFAVKENHPTFGRSSSWSVCSYNQINFKSSWEANFAKWCDLSEIKWQYEPKAFYLGGTTYTPDFYLPEFDCWIEIKGWWIGLAKKKFNFVKNHFDIRLKLFDERKLKQLGVI